MEFVDLTKSMILFDSTVVDFYMIFWRLTLKSYYNRSLSEKI